MGNQIELLIVGAGPYGLALGRQAQTQGITCVVVGKPMAFWHEHMPKGMWLRTPCDWADADTLANYMQARQIKPGDIDPVPLEFFTAYVEDSVHKSRLQIIPDLVVALNHDNKGFRCKLQNGQQLHARKVVVATGYYPYRHIPEEFRTLLPPHRCSHTADIASIPDLRDKRCLIIGGRQSAFEWALQFKENNTSTTLVYRHDTPSFGRSDWNWVYPYIESTRSQRGWFRNLPAEQQRQINDRIWTEGRLRLEDWLQDSLHDSHVTLKPKTQVRACREAVDGALDVRLSDGSTVQVDHILLATGYKVDISKLDFLARGPLFERIASTDGYPLLDEHFQSSIPGLYFIGIHAVREFGPFLFFVAFSDVAAEIIGQHLAAPT